MSWKDWLYIPKSDRIAIAILFLIIAILSGINFVISRQQKVQEDYDYNIPDDYKEWQQKLIKHNEPQDKATRTYHKPYTQTKMGQGETIELNSADTTLLKMIPGIGSMFANRIVNYRTALGGYANIEQLNEVWGLDTYLYSTIVPYLTLDAKHDSIYINQDSFQELLAHPYLNYKQVQAITDIRERKGKIRSLKRLSLLEEFKESDIRRLSFYISFGEK